MAEHDTPDPFERITSLSNELADVKAQLKEATTKATDGAIAQRKLEELQAEHERVYAKRREALEEAAASSHRADQAEADARVAKEDLQEALAALADKDQQIEKLRQDASDAVDTKSAAEEALGYAEQKIQQLKGKLESIGSLIAE